MSFTHTCFVCVHTYGAPENVLRMQRKDTVPVLERLYGAGPQKRVLTWAGRLWGWGQCPGGGGPSQIYLEGEVADTQERSSCAKGQ